MAAVGLVPDVVDLARRRGLMTAAGPPAPLIPQDHRVADPGRDRAGVPDVERQARPGQPGAQLPGPQETGQAARTGQQVRGLADDRLPDRLPRTYPTAGPARTAAHRNRPGRGSLAGPGAAGSGRGWRRGGVAGRVGGLAGPGGRGRVRLGVTAGAVACQLQAERDEVVQDAGVDVAGDDRGDRGVAGQGAGGVAVQPGAAVAAGPVGGFGAAGRPADPHLGDPLGLQHRPVIQSAQLGQRDVRPHLDRLPGAFGEQAAGGQPAHASAVILRHDGLMDDMQADRAEAQLRAGVYGRLSETYDAAESMPT